jgi:hypothetical protein
MPRNTLLLIFLTNLLAECKSNKTTLEEGRGKISISPERGEVVHVFKIDNTSGRQVLQMQEGTICDGLIFLGKELEAPRRYMETFCLVELKGGDIEHAIKQILNTHTNLWKLLLDSKCKDQLSTFKKKAYIYQHGSAPRQTKQLAALRGQLKDIFSDNYRIARDSDIGPFLRK